MKMYRNHRCESQHRTERTFIKCAIGRLAWVHGIGDLALIAWCRVPTVTLHSDAANAKKAMEVIDGTGCGGRCTGRHEIVRVVLEEGSR